MSEAKRLASLIMHKHYCEHDVEEIIALTKPLEISKLLEVIHQWVD